MTDLLFRPQTPTTPDAQLLLAELSAALTNITGDNGMRHFHAARMNEPGSYFVVAYHEQQPTACGSFQKIDIGTAELKRIYTRPNTSGIGSKLLRHLELTARSEGYQRLICETRKINTAAVTFYLKNDYQIIRNYGHYQGRADAVCFAKTL
ncbi:hypothetical protein A5886_000213 [Enterococcus sp. 8G7_MSG3316]|uniref:N-acetyltransferase domain-containing protein n=1 Tax=Candidatus Enterococcus testudinis TaxID=1834191 RepID=A0A242A3G1_9ENTE|nr:GNAT family N-acetyltransferase [Enterococcus sp. 8G7_MSG3316]OTN75143.1 hypothetical protein A5886_000213 [Enterococcus sp. 8G7_MSG3316]